MGPLSPPSTISQQELRQLRDLTNNYEDASADEITLLSRYLEVQQQAADLAEQVTQLNAVVVGVQAELITEQRKVELADANARSALARLEEAEDQLELERERLRTQAVQAYMGGGHGTGTAEADAVMRASSVNDLGKSVAYADAVVADQRATIQRVTKLRNDVEARRTDADRAQRLAIDARDEVKKRGELLVAQRDAQADLQRQLAKGAEDYQATLVEVSQKRADYARRISVLAQVSDGISETLRTRQAGQSLPVNMAGLYLSPLPNPRFTSPYGVRPDPLAGGVGMHNGVDLNGITGTPIRAPADGVVLIAGSVEGYGNCTVIDHGNGLGTLYGHQSAFAAQAGDQVRRGQVIGYVGSTGRSTGPHLHWEVRRFGQPVDPVPFIGDVRP